jgi:F420-0:gamma-glutamyl ligase-like protein
MPNDHTLHPGYFTAPVATSDPLIAEAIAHELTRRQGVIVLTANRNSLAASGGTSAPRRRH